MAINSDRVEYFSSCDISLPSQIAIKEIIHQLETTETGIVARFKGYSLSSAFQPIYSFAHKKPIGYEALLRVKDQNYKIVPPLELFDSLDSPVDSFHLEQLSIILHIINFVREGNRDAWLFLNINPDFMSSCDGCLKYLLEIFNEYGICPNRVVIEFVEDSVSDFDNLIKVSEYLKHSGCMIAIDDFGAGHSNFNRIWDLKPDIVKLDKSMLKRLNQKQGFHKTLESLVKLLHESETMVLLEGVENIDDAKLAREMDVDLHQGWFLGHPQKSLQQIDEIKNPLLDDSNNFYDSVTYRDNIGVLSTELYFLFKQSAAGVTPDYPLNEFCEELLNYPYLICCYLLDENGYQIGESVHGHFSKKIIDLKQRILGNTEGANWSRRPYFQNAISNPLSVQTTRPYLSLSSMQMCITLSISIYANEKHYVFCCDISSKEFTV